MIYTTSEAQDMFFELIESYIGNYESANSFDNVDIKAIFNYVFPATDIINRTCRYELTSGDDPAPWLKNSDDQDDFISCFTNNYFRAFDIAVIGEFLTRACQKLDKKYPKANVDLLSEKEWLDEGECWGSFFIGVQAVDSCGERIMIAFVPGISEVDCDTCWDVLSKTVTQDDTFFSYIDSWLGSFEETKVKFEFALERVYQKL